MNNLKLNLQKEYGILEENIAKLEGFLVINYYGCTPGWGYYFDWLFNLGCLI